MRRSISVLDERWIEVLAFGCLSPHHATQFKAFTKQLKSRHALSSLLKGEIGWPSAPEDRDVLYFLSQSFRARLIKELPQKRATLSASQQELSHRAKALLKELASISLEMAQMVVTGDGNSKDASNVLPDWFLTEIVRDLPRLVEKKTK